LLRFAKPVAMDRWRVLCAKAYAIAWAHYLLHTVPVAFVIRYVDHSFLFYYFEHRQRYKTLRVLLYVIMAAMAPGAVVWVMEKPFHDGESKRASSRSSAEDAPKGDLGWQLIWHSAMSGPACVLVLMLFTAIVYFLGLYPATRIFF